MPCAGLFYEEFSNQLSASSCFMSYWLKCGRTPQSPLRPHAVPPYATGAKPFGGSLPSVRPVRVQRPSTICDAAALQFIKGVDESTVPEVTLKRNRTGTAGTAVFVFDNPSIFQASSELGDITGA
jgi:hypothetical protein